MTYNKNFIFEKSILIGIIIMITLKFKYKINLRQ